MLSSREGGPNQYTAVDSLTSISSSSLRIDMLLSSACFPRARRADISIAGFWGSDMLGELPFALCVTECPTRSPTETVPEISGEQISACVHHGHQCPCTFTLPRRRFPSGCACASSSALSIARCFLGLKSLRSQNASPARVGSVCKGGGGTQNIGLIRVGLSCSYFHGRGDIAWMEVCAPALGLADLADRERVCSQAALLQWAKGFLARWRLNAVSERSFQKRV